MTLALPVAESSASLTRRMYEEHGDFVWRSLARLGVRAPDLRDLTQEVFIVVHRRAAERTGTSRDTTWLFGICLRVASAYRRRAHRRHEELTDQVPEGNPGADATPETELQAQRARQQLNAILDAMPLEPRAVFVMFEIDQMSGQEIADLLGCPIGTVWSRLRAARKEFEAALRRLRARETHGVKP